MRKKRDKLLIEVAERVQDRLTAIFERVGKPEPGSALDQAGLRDGLSIVKDYVRHGEGALAAEHLIYMIVDPGIELSGDDRELLRSLCEHFGVSTEELFPRPRGGD